MSSIDIIISLLMCFAVFASYYRSGWFERTLNWIFDHRDIQNCEHSVYLRRWFLIRTKPIAIFLHKFERSDEDRALHDHPWSFITFILWRGYTEIYSCQRCGSGHTKRARRWPMTIGFRPAEWRHRVELINEKPAWTLVIRFRKRRDWGFWEGGEWIQWNKWWQDKCE